MMFYVLYSFHALVYIVFIFLYFFTFCRQEPPISRETVKEPIVSSTGENADKKVQPSVNETEFVSESFKASEEALEEVRADMKKLGIDTLVKQASEGIGNAAEKSGKICGWCSVEFGKRQRKSQQLLMVLRGILGSDVHVYTIFFRLKHSYVLSINDGMIQRVNFNLLSKINTTTIELTWARVYVCDYEAILHKSDLPTRTIPNVKCMA